MNKNRKLALIVGLAVALALTLGFAFSRSGANGETRNAGQTTAANDGYAEVDSPFGAVGLLAPLVPDVALLHAPVADRGRWSRGSNWTCPVFWFRRIQFRGFGGS